MKNLILLLALATVCSCTTNKALKKAKSNDWGPTAMAYQSNFSTVSLR